MDIKSRKKQINKNIQYTFCKILMLFTIILICGMSSMGLKAANAAGAWNGDFYIDNGVLVDYRGSGGDVTIPSTVKTIGQHAFCNNDYIRTVTIPVTVETIDASAFWDCDSLEKVIFDNDSPIITINQYTFYECDSLVSICLPKNIVSIQEYAFEYCRNLVKIYLPVATVNIKQMAFEYTSLNAIYYEGSEAQWNRISRGSWAFGWSGGEYYGQLFCNAKVSDFGNGTAPIGSGLKTPGQFYWDYSRENRLNGLALTINGKKQQSGDDTDGCSEAIFFTDVLASYKFVSGTGSNTKCATGKIIIGITDSADIPNASKLVERSDIAQVKIKNGVVSVKAVGNPGEYYIHVLDTGDEQNHACCRLTIKAAPSEIDVVAGELKKENNTITLIAGGASNVFLTPRFKTSSGLQEANYYELSAKLPKKAAGFLTVESTLQRKDGVESIRDNIFRIWALGLNKGKKVTSSIEFVDELSKAKAKVKLNIINPVSDISLKADSSSKLGQPESESSSEGVDFVYNCEGTETVGKITTTINLDICTLSELEEYYSIHYKDCYWDVNQGHWVSNNSCLPNDNDFIEFAHNEYHHNFPTTDTGKIIALASPESIIKSELVSSGKIKCSDSPSKEQKKISAKLSKNNDKITVTIANKTPVGTKAYFALFYNNGIEDYFEDEYGQSNKSPNRDHQGYIIFSVEVRGESLMGIELEAPNQKKDTINAAPGKSYPINYNFLFAESFKGEYDGDMKWEILNLDGSAWTDIKLEDKSSIKGISVDKNGVVSIDSLIPVGTKAKVRLTAGDNMCTTGELLINVVEANPANLITATLKKGGKTVDTSSGEITVEQGDIYTLAPKLSAALGTTTSYTVCTAPAGVDVKYDYNTNLYTIKILALPAADAKAELVVKSSDHTDGTSDIITIKLKAPVIE